MILREVLTKGRVFLNNFENGFLDAEVLLQFVLNKPKEFLISHYEESVPLNIYQKYFAFLEDVKSGKPIAYLTNSKEFYGLNFYVDERVLIPRPESEMLIDKTKEVVRGFQKKLKKKIKILDIGTGCGNLALSLAKELNNVEITGIDISRNAITVAEKNLKLLTPANPVRFILSDLLNNIADQQFDIFICNLPYIGLKFNNFVEKKVKENEPFEALFSGDDGLFCYGRLFEQINNIKNKPKVIIAEYGFKGQEKPLKQIFDKIFCSNVDIKFYKDLAGNPRMFVVSFAK